MRATAIKLNVEQVFDNLVCERVHEPYVEIDYSTFSGLVKTTDTITTAGSFERDKNNFIKLFPNAAKPAGAAAATPANPGMVGFMIRKTIKDVATGTNAAAFENDMTITGNVVDGSDSVSIYSTFADYAKPDRNLLSCDCTCPLSSQVAEVRGVQLIRKIDENYYYIPNDADHRQKFAELYVSVINNKGALVPPSHYIVASIDSISKAVFKPSPPPDPKDLNADHLTALYVVKLDREVPNFSGYVSDDLGPDEKLLNPDSTHPFPAYDFMPDPQHYVGTKTSTLYIRATADSANTLMQLFPKGKLLSFNYSIIPGPPTRGSDSEQKIQRKLNTIESIQMLR